ncbi:MAG TPA: hypothetical protein VGH38_21480 [Bryobacteraceae bacterium]
MLAASPYAQPPAQEIREPYSKASQDGLFDALTKLAEEVPLLAMVRAPLLESEAQRDRILRLGFASALARQRDVAAIYLPAVLDRPWIGETSFPNACALARLLDGELPEAAEKLLWAIARRNPDVVMRETDGYLDLSFGRRLFERVVKAAPDEAVALASGGSKSAIRFREALKASQDGEIRVLAGLSESGGIDAPRLRRVSILSGRIARGDLTIPAALQLAGNFPRYFAAVADLRIAAAAGEGEFLDRALESESLTFCRAYQEGGGRALAGDLAGFSARDLYLLLAYGRAESNEQIFSAAFDRLLLPKLRAAGSKASILAILNRTHDLKLRDFAAAALAVHRLEAFQQVAGVEVMGRLARALDRADDPLQAAVTVAEVIDGGSGRAGMDQLAATIAAEYARTGASGDRQTQALYGLLAARMVQESGEGTAPKEIAEKYLPYLKSASRVETASLFGENKLCVERHFFYDDDDGVQSYLSFKSVYERDAAWKIEDHGGYLEITSEGAGGRRIEIFANVPIDGHLAANAGRTDEALRRQQAISAALGERGLVPTFLVHRGHSFWVERTIRYVNSAAKMVFLGSCGGATNVHSVIERSRDAQVIATRGVGTTSLNDAILKSLNDWLLRGDKAIEWSSFWQAQKAQLGRNPMFRDYFAPHQDTASILMRAYFQCAE